MNNSRMSDNALTLPNWITLGRLALAPAIAWLLLTERYEWAAWGFLAVAFSDWLDGYLARRWQQITRLGTVLDPVADKFTTLCTLVPLVWTTHLPLALAGLLIGRDIVILAAAVSASKSTGVMEFPPSRLGKLHTFMLFALIALLLSQAAGWTHFGALFPWVFIAPVVTAVVSCVHYVWSFARQHHASASSAPPLTNEGLH